MVRSITNKNINTFQDPEYGIPAINNQMAEVSRNQNQLNRLGAGSGMSLNEIKEMSPPGILIQLLHKNFNKYNKELLIKII